MEIVTKRKESNFIGETKVVMEKLHRLAGANKTEALPSASETVDSAKQIVVVLEKSIDRLIAVESHVDYGFDV